MCHPISIHSTGYQYKKLHSYFYLFFIISCLHFFSKTMKGVKTANYIHTASVVHDDAVEILTAVSITIICMYVP